MTFTPFDFQPTTRIVFGPDKVDELGQLAQQLGGGRALVVTDAGLVAAGHANHSLAALAAAGIAAEVFAQVHENPSTLDVETGAQLARQFQPTLLVGLGGGSSMDCAKGINFLYSCGGRMQDYWGVGKATGPMLPMIAVPTTAGTGSETQSFALISDADTHTKMACGDKRAACRVAILDPKLTLTQPPRVTALTGLDAIAHAVESYVATRRNPLSLCFAREAWRHLEDSFSRVLRDPTDLEARAGMQLGASLAGLSIEHSMLGAAHALANPLTAQFGVAHGQAVSLMLPHVVRFNGVACQTWYQELLAASSGQNGAPRVEHGADGLADFLMSLVDSAALPTRLGALGIDESRLDDLAAAAARQWTAGFNPRAVGIAELRELYRGAL
ncbi:MAG: iron-containing alcohol dehydrogenase [Pirellulales bacterium]|nr:iron-containing alcohol dehydrogenase [Pirellulales bacterium]